MTEIFYVSEGALSEQGAWAQQGAGCRHLRS